MKMLLKKWGITPTQVIRFGALGIVVVLVLLYATGSLHQSGPRASKVMAGTQPAVMQGGTYYGDRFARTDYAVEEMSVLYDEYGTERNHGQGVVLSSRNVAGAMLSDYYAGGTTGDGAEDFDVTQYSLSYETHAASRTCGSILELKARPEIVFESTQVHEKGCGLTFKVVNPAVPEVLATLKGLHPRDVFENTYSIEREVRDFTSEQEILQQKLSAIDDTLESSLSAYEEITKVATASENADALSRIIDSRVSIIERLTRERIMVTAELDRLAKRKSAELDNLVYTRFSVDVYQKQIVDKEAIKESWKDALRVFVYNVNAAVQGLTVGLVGAFLILIQYLLYLVLLVGLVLVVAKYGWKLVKHFWNT